MKEIETKIVNIVPHKVRKILLQKGAKKVKNVFQRNTRYANNDTPKTKVLVRIRQEGKNVWMTVKSPKKIVKGYKIREEYEIPMPSLTTAERMLSLLGYKIKGISECYREYFALYGCSVEILKMPKIPPFLEIEGHPKNVERVAKLLGYSPKDFVPQTVFEYYRLKSNFLQFNKSTNAPYIKKR